MSGQDKPKGRVDTYPLKIFSFGLAVTVLTMLVLGAYSWRSYQSFQHEEEHINRLQQATNEARKNTDLVLLWLSLALADEVTISTEQYEALTVYFDQNLPRIVDLAEDPVTKDATRQLVAAFQELDQAVIGILSDARDTSTVDVAALLNDPEYQRLSLAYLDSINNLSLAIQKSIDTEIRQQHFWLLVISLSVAGSLLVVAALWFTVINATRRYIRDRDRAEERLRLLSSAVEATQDGVQIVDMDGRITYSNRAVEGIFGYTPAEYLGMSVDSMNAEPDFASKEILPAIRESGRWSGELMVRHKAGHTFPIWLTTSMIIDSDGQPLAMVGGIRDISEIRATEEALRESEERYRLLFQNMNEIAWSIRIIPGEPLFESPIIYVNDRVRDVIGFTPAELIENPGLLFTAVHPDDVDQLKTSTEALIELKKPIVRNLRIRNKESGEYVWLEENVVPMTGIDGEVTSLFGVARDITARKQSEETLVEVAAGVSGTTGRSFFRSLVKHLNKALGADIAFIGELHQDRHTISTIAVNAHGEPADNFEYSLPGTPCENVVGESPCAYPSNVQESFPDDKDLMEMQIEGYIGTPLFDSGGEPLGIVVVLYHDPVESVETASRLLEIFASRAAAELERLGVEQALSRSEAKYRTLFEESQDAVYLASLEGRFLDMNAAGIELLGYESLEEVQRLALATDVYADEADRERFLNDLAGAGYLKDYELRLKRKDGEVRTCSISATLTYDEDGAVSGNWGIARDISQHRQIEEQLIQAQKMESVGRLAGGVAHDFNNFLTAVQGYIEMAIAELPLNSPVQPELVEAARAADRAVEVTRQLLLFSRHGQLKPVAVDLNSVVAGIINMLGHLIGERYRITTTLEEHLPPVKVDTGYMEQVLLNLVVNAKDAMPDGGEIVVGTQDFEPLGPAVDFSGVTHFGEYVCLWVQDFGEGMDKSTKARIFDPFFSTKSVGAGTGLGLSVVYGIIEQHGGWVEVESSPDQGSTFRVFLPVALEAIDEKSPELPAARVDLTGRGEKVLLVEDEETVRKLGTRMLAESGYEVRAAASAEEARLMFKAANGDFDLLFSDVILPNVTGVDLATELTAKKPELKVVLASGYTGEVIDVADIEARGYYFLQKPYSLKDLKLVLRRLLEEDGS